MTMRIPDPASIESSPEASLPFYVWQPGQRAKPSLATYKQLCPGGLDDDDVKEDARNAE